MRIIICAAIFAFLFGCGTAEKKAEINVNAGPHEQAEKSSVKELIELPKKIQDNIDERNAAYSQTGADSYERVQSKGAFTLKVILGVQAGFTIVSKDKSYSESFYNIKEKVVKLAQPGMYKIHFHKKDGYIPIKPMNFEAFSGKNGFIEGKYKKIQK